MSEREKMDNARRAGTRAYYAGVRFEDCPLRARDSRYFWECAWREAQAFEARGGTGLKKQLQRMKRSNDDGDQADDQAD